MVGRVFSNLRFSQINNCRVITRFDFTSDRSNPEECVIKALMWAFPNNVNKSSAPAVLVNMQRILSITSNHVGKTLNESDFIDLCAKIKSIRGVSDCTISIIMYALGISFEERKSIAITTHTLNAFKKFEELHDFYESGYIPQLMKLNIEANELGVDVEVLEYYLFRVSSEKLKLI